MMLCHCFNLFADEAMTNVHCVLCKLEGGNAEDEDGGDVKGHARADGGVQPAPGSRRLWGQHWLPVKEMRQPAQPKGEREQPEKLERGQHSEHRQRAVDPRRRPARPQPPERGAGEASAAAHGTIQICSSALFITQFISFFITLASIFLAFSGSKIRSTKRIAGLALGARMSLTWGHCWSATHTPLDAIINPRLSRFLSHPG